MPIKYSPANLAPYVLLPGDPGRVPVVAKYWDTARKVAEHREFVTYTGTYRGAPISCASTGIGCPSTSVALEELARGGATTFIRIGTCGTFQENIARGDIVIFDSAARYDGASHLYVPPQFPAVAHHEVVQACVEVGKKLGWKCPVGTTRTADTFYACHPRPGSSFHDFWQSPWRDFFLDLKRQNILAAEMEASIIFVLARVWGLRAGGIAVVLDNMIQVAESGEKFDPEKHLDHSPDYIEKLALMGSEIVLHLHQQDQKMPQP
jgi:uridine phosphorylase